MTNFSVQIDIDVADDVDPTFLSRSNLNRDQLDKISAAISTNAALTSHHSCTLRIVDGDESRSLNNTYRHKDKSTNVLSFPAELPDFVDSDFIGDLALCADVVEDEAKTQGKSLTSHTQHMVVHGVLHLMGYDHIEEKDAQEMESMEIEILAELGIDDPYQLQ